MDGNKNLVLPNFLCIGAQKTGTTTLYQILKEHPDVTVSRPRKETKYFYRDEEYKLGLEFYSKFFSYEKPKKAIGEFDPDYLYFPYVAERIYNDLGTDVKFIVMFRNPVDRAYSQYLMSIHKGMEKLSFEEALKHEMKRIEKGGRIEKNNFSYISRGLYDEQLSRYFKFFSKENFLFINYDEEFKNDLAGTLNKICNFLGIAQLELNINIRANEASKVKSETLRNLVRKNNPIKRMLLKFISDPELKRKIRKKILNWNRTNIKVVPLGENIRKELYQDYFSSSIEHLEKLTGENFSSWKPKSN